MTDSKIGRAHRIDERCVVVAELVSAMRPFYLTASVAQRAFLETIVGAGIWYIPKDENAWTGQMSIGFLRAFHPASGIVKPKASEEHVYPRKMTARQLFEDPSVDLTALSTHFRERYGKVHYITPAENKTVTRHQRSDVFSSPESAYVNAGISFVSVSSADLSKIRKRDLATIEKYLSDVVIQRMTHDV
ncbi:MAG: hypothetical protein ABJC26_15925 [Gemmatimonadaceae bacterium]